MHVLHVMSSQGVYGAERVLLGLLSGLSGVSSCVALFAKPDGTHKSFANAVRAIGCRVFELPDDLRDVPKAALQIRELVRVHEIEVVQSHGYKENVLCALALSGLATPRLIFTQHGFTGKNTKSRVYGQIDRWAGRLARVESIVCVSKAIEQAYRKAGVPPTKLIHMRNGVSVPEATSRDKFDYDFAFIGRLSPEKGPDVLITALENWAGPRPSVVFTGTGPLEAQLRERVEDLGLADNVTFLGFVSEPRRIMRRSRVLLIPSYTEGLPMSLLEALSEAMPVIASGVGEIPSVHRLGDWGKLMKPGDSAGLREVMCEALANWSQWCERGLVGRQVVSEHYNQIDVLNDWYALYRGDDDGHCALGVIA